MIIIPNRRKMVTMVLPGAICRNFYEFLAVSGNNHSCGCAGRTEVRGRHAAHVILLNPGYAFVVSLSVLYISHVTQDACTASEFAESVCKQFDYTYASDPLQFLRPGIATEVTLI